MSETLPVTRHTLSCLPPAGSTVADFFDTYGMTLCYHDITLPLDVSIGAFLSLPYVENCFEGISVDIYPELNALVDDNGVLRAYRDRDGSVTFFLDSEWLRALPRARSELGIRGILLHLQHIVSFRHIWKQIPGEEAAAHVLARALEVLGAGELHLYLNCDLALMKRVLDGVRQLSGLLPSGNVSIIGLRPRVSRGCVSRGFDIRSVYSSLQQLLVTIGNIDHVSLPVEVLDPIPTEDDVAPFRAAISEVMMFLAANKMHLSSLYLNSILPTEHSIAAAAVNCDRVVIAENLENGPENNLDYKALLEELGRREANGVTLDISSCCRLANVDEVEELATKLRSP